MKIFYQGRRINGRFDSIKSFVRRVVRFTVRWSLISAAAYAVFMAGAAFYSTSTVTATTTDSFPAKLDALKADIVDRLSQCESAGHSEADGIIVFDSNAKASIGQLQFQKATVQYYYKALYGQEITAKEAVLIALDTEKAKALATDIIFTTKNGTTDWLNCSNKLGLSAEVSAIKRLAQ